MSKLESYFNLCKTIMKTKLAYNGLIATPYPFRLNVAVTYQCNSRCKMCGIWKIYKDSPNVGQELTVHDYDSLFKALSSNLFWLGLTGGEPFLRKDLIDIILLASSKLRKVHILELTTNGLSPHVVEKTVDEILRTSKFPFITLGVSMDGPSLLHDQIRGVKGAWNRALTTYKKLCEISNSYPNFSPHISYTISQYNAGNFEKFLQTVKKEAGIDLNSISVTIENMGHMYHRSHGSCSDRDSFVHQAETDIRFLLKEINVQVSKSLNKSGIEIGRQLFKKLFLASSLKFLDNPTKMIMPCAALIGSCFIDPLGYLYPCTVYGEKIGNIKDAGFASLWNSQLANKLRKDIKLGRCPNCWSPCEAEPSFLSCLPKSLLSAMVMKV